MQYACRVTSSSKTSRDFARQVSRSRFLFAVAVGKEDDAVFAGTKAIAFVRGESGFSFLRLSANQSHLIQLASLEAWENQPGEPSGEILIRGERSLREYY